MKKHNRMKEHQAVTLVALVITVIIMLILAGVAINLTIGENGLFRKAEEGTGIYKESANNEIKDLNDVEGTISELIKGTQLPENTEETIAGTKVKMPDNWYTSTPSYVASETGVEVIKTSKVASVEAVSDGKVNTIPVPIGFYYVGGTLETGLVISDRKEDQNKYAGQEEVPAGTIYNTNGTVKAENELTEEEKKTVILGNQFVWIPVSTSEYVKKDWGKANATWERQTNTAELPQIQKYGGFYIGRYEAGTSEITLSTGINFENQNTASNWDNDNFSIRDGLNHTVTGKITLKAGEIPYYHTDYETALKLSNSMYQTDYVQSGLVTGTMWDAMMKFIAGSDDTVVTSSTWGNYINGNVTYTQGHGRYATVNSDNGETSAFTVSNGNYNYGIKTTAISEDVKKKNLYDVAGNLWEWTQEASYPNDTLESYMLRGGSFNDACMVSGCPVCYRGYGVAGDTYTNSSFRPALYIK